MHPPAGGSSAFEGFLAQLIAESPELHLVSQRRVTRATATGVMLPTHNPLLRYSAVLPALLLFLILSVAPLVSSSPASCRPGHTFWDSGSEACVPCTRCVSQEAPFVLVPCQPHRDVRCGKLAELGIDWSWMRTPQVQNQRRARPNFQKPSVTPRTPSVSPTPHYGGGVTRKVPRPRAPEPGRVPESAARVMVESREPPRLPAEGEVLPSVREEEAAWTWQHWLVAGVAMSVVCASVMALAPLAVRRMRGWDRCSTCGRKNKRSESRKRQFRKIDKSDHGMSKGGTKGAVGEGGHGFYSANQHILLMEEILDRKKAAAWDSMRDESTNEYVEDTTVKLVPPSSSITVATMIPGMVPSVKVEVEGDNKKHRNLATNCLRLGCASRTVFTGRSSAV